MTPTPWTQPSPHGPLIVGFEAPNGDLLMLDQRSRSMTRALADLRAGEFSRLYRLRDGVWVGGGRMGHAAASV